MNIKKKIIFIALGLLLSNTFNSAYSAYGAGGEANQPNYPSRELFIYSVTQSDGPGAAGGAGLPLEGLAATPSNAPRGWEQHVRTGVAYFKQGKLLDAIAQYTAALAIEGIDGKTRAGCLYGLGTLYFEQGKFLAGLYGLGTAYATQMKFSDAIDQCTAALAIEGIDGKTRASCLNQLGLSRFRLGAVYFGQNKFSDAIDQYRLASKFIPMQVRQELEGPLGIELLMHAVDIESQENAKFLLANGVNINAEDNRGETALMRTKSVEMAEFLLERGADVNAENFKGESPLLHAIQNSNVEKLALLLSRKADVNAGRYAQFYLLFAFSRAHETELLNLLLNSGVEVNPRDIYGKTALMEFVTGFSDRGLQSLLLLIERGANVNAVDNKGRTALVYAVNKYSHIEMYWRGTLLDRGACLEQLKARVTLLINSGAEIDIQDIDGRNVLDICKSEDLKEYIRTMYGAYQSTGIGLK